MPSITQNLMFAKCPKVSADVDTIEVHVCRIFRYIEIHLSLHPHVFFNAEVCFCKYNAKFLFDFEFDM